MRVEITNSLTDGLSVFPQVDYHWEQKCHQRQFDDWIRLNRSAVWRYRVEKSLRTDNKSFIVSKKIKTITVGKKFDIDFSIEFCDETSLGRMLSPTMIIPER